MCIGISSRDIGLVQFQLHRLFSGLMCRKASPVIEAMFQVPPGVLEVPFCLVREVPTSLHPYPPSTRRSKPKIRLAAWPSP